ncbi:sigma-70 family RNA polymerase sigma factor [Parahaliea mediterranea]|uniref:Sigma-70 family RNA polymerase sigma factor n=1 Tax=Parahaliea mediterranea TaxID=651086 RepID=A0A939DDM8_9GAMM|nr:sigma-70 family RNA polymerase sigma factor [Parahaliea mediterranea]MBN7796159.1 sigma-70 family RNA polymerase sigma factor [Parahaliea mediterranea]
MPSDESRWSRLMASAQRGDESDYRQLLEELSRAIHGFLLVRIGATHFTEDCVQECLVAIHCARHSYDPGRPFKPWLFAIVRHKAVDVLRRQGSYERARARQRELLQVAALDADPGEYLTAGEGQLLGKLVTGQREAITLTKIEGLSTAEAARVLNISESAVKVRVHRGLGRLKQLMAME